ncbi:MAG: YebC/PmpR family DNA-binding transcriptional regulator [Mariprofundaceae bacterium]|nr:YebC/PmpR family DNA-binding transcriptional regulator [Mariprofundaceae bacterium]
MSGHSKWSTIKHKKAATDAKRGKVFTRFIREITIAARLGGADLDANPRLRSAVSSAKGVNMPNVNIDRAIQRGAGGDDGVQLDEIRYEGYGQGGVALIVDCMTDNRNRTVSDVRSSFSKGGGNMGESGCVSWMFAHKGQFVFDRELYNEEHLLDLALESGADDVIDHPSDGFIEVLCDSTAFHEVHLAFEAKKLVTESAALTWIPENIIAIAGEEAEKLLRLIERLEDCDDVQNVYANYDISDEDMERFS